MPGARNSKYIGSNQPHIMASAFPVPLINVAWASHFYYTCTVEPHPPPRTVTMPDMLSRYAPHNDSLYTSVLAAVLDGLGHHTSTLPPDIRPLKPEWKLFGRAATLSCVTVASEPARPYALELACIDALKPGDVLIATTNGH